MGHLLISKIYGYCIYALAVFTKKIKPKPNTFVFDLGFDWRKEWDSNPRYVAVYLISSQGRYDHFDIFPYYLRHKIPCANFLSIISYFVRFVNCFVAVFHFSHCFLRGGVLKSFSDKARNQRIPKSIGLAFVITNYLKGFFCFPIQNMLYSDEYQFTVFRDLHLFKT